MSKKYFIGTVHEVNGSMEYDTKYLFTIDKGQNRDEHTRKVAMEWRGGDEEDYDEYYDCFRSNGSFIFDHGSKQITKEEFDVMKKHLAVLYSK